MKLPSRACVSARQVRMGRTRSGSSGQPLYLQAAASSNREPAYTWRLPNMEPVDPGVEIKNRVPKPQWFVQSLVCTAVHLFIGYADRRILTRLATFRARMLKLMSSNSTFQAPPSFLQSGSSQHDHAVSGSSESDCPKVIACQGALFTTDCTHKACPKLLTTR